MSKGTIYPSESLTFKDARTGAEIRQVTTTFALHHHPFFIIPAYDDEMKRLIFVSHRTGTPQIFAEIRATGELMQLTNQQYVVYTLDEHFTIEEFNGEWLKEIGDVDPKRKVCKLNKAVYGLIQASREFYLEISNFLI